MPNDVTSLHDLSDSDWRRIVQAVKTLRHTSDEYAALYDRLPADRPESAAGVGVLVATFRTNMVGTDEANLPIVHVFDRREYEANSPRDEDMHAFARPRLENRYGIVDGLRMHPTRIRPLRTPEDADA